jgi:F-type H+-transporting ATPase subunit a
VGRTRRPIEFNRGAPRRLRRVERGKTRVASGSSIDLLGQFELNTVLGPIGASVNFSQSNVFMVIASALLLGMIYYGMRPRAVVPGRLQSLAELSYKFIHDMCVDQIGPEGVRFFPFVFTLFFFILFGNLLGLLPFGFAYTSHISVTLALALTVFVLSIAVAVSIHGLHFFSYFVPEGLPAVLMPLIVVIEILSFLSRPISLSVRLFANMLAGHVLLELFGAFVVIIGALGAFGVVGSLLPLSLNIALIGFELLVSLLQAYVFAILTCIYLHDAVHLH